MIKLEPLKLPLHVRNAILLVEGESYGAYESGDIIIEILKIKYE